MTLIPQWTLGFRTPTVLMVSLIMHIYFTSPDSSFCPLCFLVAQSCPTLLWPRGVEPTRLLCLWDFPGKNTGVGCHFLGFHSFKQRFVDLCAMSQILKTQIQNEFDSHYRKLASLSLLPSINYFLKSHSFVLYLQQIQSNFIVVIHPGSTTLRIGRATDTLPASIPHVIARRHKQQGQPLYKDSWLLREGLNVSQDEDLEGVPWQSRG